MVVAPERIKAELFRALRDLREFLAGLQMRGRLLEDRAPATVAAFRAALPLKGSAFQDQYGAQIMRITSRLNVDPSRLVQPGYV